MGQRNIGKSGENFFEAWCNSAGIVANPSTSDQNGWDVFIEMNNPESDLDPTRIHEGMVEAKVQIKSTDNDKKYVDIELSNLYKMSTTLLPAFYVLIQFDGTEAPVKAYVKHVDDVLIDEILKRISKLKNQNPHVRLNKRKKRIFFTDEITPLTSSTLKCLLKKYLGSAQSKYVDRKRRALETAGYETYPYQIHFSIEGSQQFSNFIDASLGRKVDVEVKEFQGLVKRFGLSSKVPQLSSSRAVLSLMDILPDDKGRVTVRQQLTGHSLTFQADFYRGVINRFLPADQRQVRIDAHIFELLVRYDRGSITFTTTIEDDDPYDVEELLKFFSVFQMLGEPHGITLQLDFFDVKPRFRLKSTNTFNGYAYQITVLRKLVDIKRNFDFTEPFKLSLKEIESHLERLHWMHPLFLESSFPTEFFFTAKDVLPQGIDAHFFYVASLQMGQYLFIDLIVLTGVIEAEINKRQKVVGVDKDSIYKTVVECQDISVEDLKRDIEAAVQNHGTQFAIVDFTQVFFSDVLGIPQESSSV